MRFLAYCAPANYSNDNLDEIAELLIENGIESQLPKYSERTGGISFISCVNIIKSESKRTHREH